MTQHPGPDVVLVRLTGYLPDVLAGMADAAAYADATFAWPKTTHLTPEQVLDACITETTPPPHSLVHFDTAAAVLLTLGIDPEEAAHCVAAYPALAPDDDGDLTVSDGFLALMHAGLTGTDAEAAHLCRLTPAETLAMLTLQGAGYLAAWTAAGYGEPELRVTLRDGDLPPIADLHGFAALRANTAPPSDW